MAWLKIAHRGAAGTRPELTRPAFERALELGVDMIELDVQLTCDRQLVVLHDRELGRTVCGSGAVRERTLAELCALPAGDWFDPPYADAPVLSLDDVLRLTEGRAALNVEIKSPAPDWAATATALIELLERHRRVASTILSSFDLGALHAVRAASGAARVGVLWHDADLAPLWPAAEALAAGSVHLQWGLADAAAVAAAHARRLAVIVWTVNDPAAIAHLAGLGVDGIISDFPERLHLAGAGTA
ncbi:MAG: glycerophosphodiester phosphodiesterase [Candidatus Binatia bacterium]